VIATDGYVTVEEEVFDLITKKILVMPICSPSHRVKRESPPFGGDGQGGNGEPFVISKPEDAREKAEKFRKMIESPVLTKLKWILESSMSMMWNQWSIPDLLAERPIIVFGKWRGKPVGEMMLSGITSNGSYVDKIDIRKEKPHKSNAASSISGRHRITLLSDYNSLHKEEGRIKEVTQLGLTYNLLTAYTLLCGH